MYFKCRLARYVTVVLLNIPNAVLIINVVDTSISTYSVHHGKMKIASLSVLTRYNCKGLHRLGFQNVAVDFMNGALNKKMYGPGQDRKDWL